MNSKLVMSKGHYAEFNIEAGILMAWKDDSSRVKVYSDADTAKLLFKAEELSVKKGCKYSEALIELIINDLKTT